MADEKKLSKAEVKRTISTSLAAAFGFVIALMWNSVVVGGLKLGGIDLTSTTLDWLGWLIYVVTAIILTVFMVILIILIGRWSSK